MENRLQSSATSVLHVTQGQIRVASHSRATAVAGAIAHRLRQSGAVSVQAMGARAVNQAVKAIALAHCYLQEEGRELSVIPEFITVQCKGGERTAIRLCVQSVLP